MKAVFLIVKKLRKGMTLLELVIAMSLTSIVFAGAGVALFSINKTSQKETKNHVTLSDAKNLVYVIDLLFKNGDYDSVNVNVGNELGKSGYAKLFSFTKNDVTTEYGFNEKIFGIKSEENNKIEGENIKYSSTYPMSVSISEKYDKFFEFVIHFGNEYKSSVSLIERKSNV